MEDEDSRMTDKSIQVILGDITKCKADAVVNAANTTLLGGLGVDGAIHRAAGMGLFWECLRLGGCKIGQARITGGHRLPAEFIIHTPGPKWKGGRRGEVLLLESCYRSSLALAEEHGCRSVAFPSISTGSYHFPLDQAAEIAVRAISEFLQCSRYVKEVRMVCFDPVAERAYREALKKRNSKEEQVYGRCIRKA